MKKLFVTLLFAWLIFAPDLHLAARDTIAVVATYWCGISGCSSSVNTTGATLIVTFQTCDGSSNMADNKSNTYTNLTGLSAGGRTLRMSYKSNPTVGSGHTFTASGSFCGWIATAFSGVTITSPLDQSSNLNNNGCTSCQPGSITPTENSELVVTGIGADNGVNITSINSGYSITHSENSGGCCYAAGLAWIAQGSATATNPTWTVTAAGNAKATQIASFKNNAPTTITPIPAIIRRPEFR